ncbi:CPBP family intramembrane glutamic endopeptidase [Marinitoga litoralis]|uniref:CPBP family intramembrane glutamic endopeptidase n=1 Tax=Marinitoga litoralis TaxID=570855 RepID=UPI0019600FF1|nr:CPBP family intramembrane glutamic endopeptidase [Marinitoga litoralis]MBM7559239.1 membrane protease YdiL (CAAX protease family) [Marinitoga litoralis]
MYKQINLYSFIFVILLLFVSWPIIFSSEYFLYLMLISTGIISFLAIFLGGDFQLKINKLEATIIFWVTILLYFLFWILNFIGGFFKFAREDIETIYHLLDNIDNIYIVIFGLALIGLFEELIWRGFIAKYLIEKINSPFLAILLSSLLYALVHIYTYNITLIIAAFIIGFLLSFIYYITGKVSTTIYIHMIWTPLIFAIFPMR